MKLHRTQLLLDEPLYDRLRRRAAEERISLSELVRRMLGRELGQTPSAPGALRLARGIFADGKMGPKDHDRVLYGS